MSQLKADQVPDSFANAVQSGEPSAAMRIFLERQKARKTTS
jgi:hypothetical protein